MVAIRSKRVCVEDSDEFWRGLYYDFAADLIAWYPELWLFSPDLIAGAQEMIVFLELIKIVRTWLDFLKLDKHCDRELRKSITVNPFKSLSKM